MSEDNNDPYPSKKRRSLTLELKLDIIKRCERGETPSKIGRSLNLNRSTICTILKDKPRILEYVKGCASMQSTIITKKRIAAIAGIANVDDTAECKKPKLDIRIPPLTNTIQERNPFQYSYPHPPKLSGPSGAPSQPTFEDSTLSLFLSETRMQNAEMRVAMGQLTDKMDNIMNKINQLSQNRSVKWRQNAKLLQDDYGEEGDDWIGDENGHTITKSKLMARIISLEEKCEILEKENVSLKKDLENSTSKLLAFQTNQFGKITETVKTAMDSVYNDLEPRFLNGVEYEGLNIRKTISSTIREVSEQLHEDSIEENIELDPCKRMKLGNLPALAKRKRKSKVKDKAADLVKVSQKVCSSETVDVATSSSGHPELEMDTENLESEHGGWKRTFEKPSDFLESTMILQDGEVITVKEENCSIVSSREGSEERAINVEPSSPPILDAGELSESGEEWLPSE